VEELAYALTRVEPPVVSSWVGGGGNKNARRPLREKRFLKKGEGRAAVSLDKYKSYEIGGGAIEDQEKWGAGGAGKVGEGQSQTRRGRGGERSRDVTSNAHTPTMGTAPAKHRGCSSGVDAGSSRVAVEERSESGITVSLGFLIACNGVAEIVEGGEGRIGQAWKALQDPLAADTVLGVVHVEQEKEQGRGRGAKSERARSKSRDKREAPCTRSSNMRHSLSRDGRRGEGNNSSDSMGNNTHVSRASTAAEEGGAHVGIDAQNPAKPFLKRKTKSVPVSNGPTKWGHVKSKVDDKFKGFPPVTHIGGFHTQDTALRNLPVGPRSGSQSARGGGAGGGGGGGVGGGRGGGGLFYP